MNLVKLLLDTYLFQDLSPAELEPLSKVATVRRCEKGQALFHRGDVALHIYVVAEGCIVYSQPAADGREMRGAIHYPGSVLGEPALLVPERIRIVDALALIDSVVIAIPGAQLTDFLLKHPKALWRLAAGMAALVRETALREAEYAFDGLRERLAWSLVELASSVDSPAREGIRLEVAQDELARMARGTRENVNRALQAMVDDRLLDVGRGYVLVLQVDELRAMAEMGSQRISRKDERAGR